VLTLDPSPRSDVELPVPDLSGRVVVVTGASSGIGRATVELLAGSGATVVCVARGEPALRSLASALADAPGHVEVQPADVTDAAALDRIARETVATFGQLDGWVGAAAVAAYGTLEELPLEEFERVLAVNVMGLVHGARAALPHFRRQGAGVLVNVGSVLGRFGAPLISPYVTSKFAVQGLSESLRMELRDEPDIAVCTVLPSSVDTPFFQHAAVHTGERPTAPSGAIDARRVARAIVGCLERPRREVVVGVLPRAVLALHAVSPGLVERLLGPVFAQDLLGGGPTEDTSGSLHEPSEDTRVSGGWPPVGGRVGRALAGAAGVATAVVGAAVAAGQRRGR
jgi:short-subunit dehydrogenase